MSGYENAPATLLVATHCACCARPLVDAVSVETGVGPECRKKHGFTQPDSDLDAVAAVAALAAGLSPDEYMEIAAKLGGDVTARRAANLLTYRIAAEQEGSRVLAYTNTVRLLGFRKLAARIERRLASVFIREDGADLVVEAPYNEAALPAWRGIPGRRWDKAAKATRLPAKEKARLWSVLRQHYAGAVAVGPKGLFRVA